MSGELKCEMRLRYTESIQKPEPGLVTFQWVPIDFTVTRPNFFSLPGAILTLCIRYASNWNSCIWKYRFRLPSSIPEKLLTGWNPWKGFVEDFSEWHRLLTWDTSQKPLDTRCPKRKTVGLCETICARVPEGLRQCVIVKRRHFEHFR